MPYKDKNKEKQNKRNHYLRHREEICQKRKEYYRNNVDKIKDQFLKRHYGVTLEQKLKIIKQQGNRCGICGTENPTETDHNHVTGQVRGVLCSKCNTGLGLLQGDLGVETLQKAINWLKKGQ